MGNPRSLARPDIAALCAVLALATLLYWPGLSGDFFFDDVANITRHSAIGALGDDAAAFQKATGGFSAGPLGRPVAKISFEINYALAGLNPLPYKATNLAVHLLTGVLVWLFVRKLARNGRGEDGAAVQWLPVWVASAWLLTPVAVTTVLFVTQRMAALATLFSVAAAYAYLAATRERANQRVRVLWIAGALACWVLALFSKEIAVVLPLILLAYELSLRHEHDQWGKQAVRILAALSVVVIVGGGVWLINSPGWMSDGYALRDFSLVERLMTEARVLWIYVSWLIVPRIGALGLYHDDVAISRSLWDPMTTVVSIVAWVAVLASLPKLARTRPLAAFGLAWFLVAHSVESSFVPLEIAFEHRNYLPSIGLFLALGSLQLPVRIQTVAGAGLLCFFALVTGMRSHQYGDELRRTQIEAAYHPASPRAQYDAGRALFVKVFDPSPNPVAEQAIRTYFRRATSASPGFKHGLVGLLHMDCRVVGQRPHPADVDELVQRYRDTKIAPGDLHLLMHVYKMLRDRNLCLEAEQVNALYRAAMENGTFPSWMKADVLLGLAEYLQREKAIDLGRGAAADARALGLTTGRQWLRIGTLEYLFGDRGRAREALVMARQHGATHDEAAGLAELLGAGDGSTGHSGDR